MSTQSSTIKGILPDKEDTALASELGELPEVFLNGWKNL
jgi:hypothetical protein